MFNIYYVQRKFHFQITIYSNEYVTYLCTEILHSLNNKKQRALNTLITNIGTVMFKVFNRRG